MKPLTPHPLSVAGYLDLKAAIVARGYTHEMDWAANVRECNNADDFAREAIWVILNSGMKEQVARGIWERMRPVIEAGGFAANTPFGHKLKCKAIDRIWDKRNRFFQSWQWRTDAERLQFLESLPHIGPITKYHLARNLGMDVCKPDRHLVRIAAPSTPEEMCKQLSEETGDRIGLVDCVIWRAANLGLI